MLFRSLFFLAVSILLLSLALTMDYHVAKAQELERIQPVMQSYSDVVVGVMNGEVRTKVGDELFECKGGSLGKV